MSDSEPGPTWQRLLPVALGALALLVLYAVRPGVVENGARSPRFWLVAGAVVLTGQAARWLVSRTTGRALLGSAAGAVVVLAAGVVLLAPSFQQRTVDEPFPAMALEAGTAAQPSAASAPSPAPTPRAPAAAPSPTVDAGPGQTIPPAAPSASPRDTSPTAAASPSTAGPRLLSSGALTGIRHSASGTTALYDLDGAGVLRFEDVDIEGTPGPVVHLVPPGARTPGAGVRIGELTAERGSFSYPLPAGVDVAAGWSVLVWCSTFDTPIAVADL